MCGIVRYVGHDPAGSHPLNAALEGLARLECQGHDSAGVITAGPGGMGTVKRTGRLDNLRMAFAHSPLLPGTATIGHTRWATHDGPTDENAHPHANFDGAIAVVHSGITENYPELALELDRRGVSRQPETDTEITAHHLALEYAKDGNLLTAICRLASCPQGSFTLVGMAGDPEVVTTRRNSPLVVGLGEGENFLESDVAAFVGSASGALELGQGTAINITADEVTAVDFEGRPTEGKRFKVNWDLSAVVKDGYGISMDKEIHEQPKAMAETLRGRTSLDERFHLGELRTDESVLRSVDKIIVVACETVAYAGHATKYTIEHQCRVPVETGLAHEFRYRDPVVDERMLVVAISQLGETMDILIAIRHAREQDSRVLAIINTHGSVIARESDTVLYTHTGSEMAVASTKAFITQITTCYLLGPCLSGLHGNKCVGEVATYLDGLGKMPNRIEEVLAEEEQVRTLARSMADVTSVLFLGRHVGSLVTLEGVLKLKELAYIHAEGFAVGELEHGPITLIEEGLSIFVIVPTPWRPLLHSRVILNLQEVRARGARVIVIAEEGDEEAASYATRVFQVPRSTPTLMVPLVTVVPLQIFTCELASVRGYDVDKPRNLAKFTTVE